MSLLIGYSNDNSKHDPIRAHEVRKKHMSNRLSQRKKLDLFNSSTKGNLTELTNLIEKEYYPPTEECSAPGDSWTCLHYAAYHGHAEIVKYLLEYYQYHPNKIDILNMQSFKGETPLIVCLNNEDLNMDKKKLILDLYLQYKAIDYYLLTKEDEDIFEICKENQK